MSKKRVSNDRIAWDAIIYCINNLDTKQLEQHDKKPYSGDALLDAINTILESGAEMKLKWDNYSDCPMVSAVWYEQGHDNSGLALSARGDGFWDAMSIVCYKFHNVAKGDLRPFSDKKPKGLRG